MTLQLDSALAALQMGGVAQKGGEHLATRLRDVQTFLSEDLAEVERSLAEVAALGPSPAPAASRHLIGTGGKRIRPMALLLSARCFGPAREKRFYEVAAVVELAHSATLLHDDVVDEGQERRGSPTARRIFGNGVSVLAGDLLLVNALARTQAHAPELLPDLIETLRRLVEGEVVQLRGRTELDVSESTYERILRDKTASLFEFAAMAGARMAGADDTAVLHLRRFGDAVGIAFQLVDDVIDYEGEQSGKTLYADLLEGKLTLPLVLAIQRDQELKSLVMKIHAGDESVVREVSRRVIDSGACQEVRARAQDFTDRAIGSLRKLPPSSSRQLLEIVAREMTQRVT